MEFKNYELSVDSRSLILSEKESKTCIFCKRMENEVSFLKTAHIIPELLGSNDQTYSTECDSCNSIFSKFESHLALFFRPNLLLTQTKGKRRVPQFISRKDDLDFTTEMKAGKDSQIKMSFDTNLEDFEVDHESKRMSVTFRKTPFRPLYVYKALVRIGLSMIHNEEYDNFEHVIQWIRKTDSELIPCFSDMHVVLLNKTKFKRPFARLYRAKKIVLGNEEFPDYILSVCFANIALQIFMPFSKEFNYQHDPKRNLSIDVYPIVAWGVLNKEYSIQIKKVDLSVFGKVTEDQKIWLEFDKYIHNSTK